jgi:hypothetical protein
VTDAQKIGVAIGVVGRADWPMWRLENLLEGLAGAEAMRSYRARLRGLPRAEQRGWLNVEIERVATAAQG